MADQIMGRGPGRDKDREPDKNKLPNKDKEEEHDQARGKGKENALEKDKDKTHHGGSANKINAGLDKGKGEKHVSEEKSSTELKVKPIHAHLPSLNFPKEHKENIDSVNLRKLTRIEGLKHREKQIRAFSDFIDSQLDDLFSKALIFPEIAKTISDTQKSIASLAKSFVTAMPSRASSGTSIFHPTIVNPIDVMRDNQWIKFLEGVTKTLLDAGKMQANLLTNDIYKDLLRHAQELHKNPSLESPAKAHPKKPNLRKEK